MWLCLADLANVDWKKRMLTQTLWHKWTNLPLMKPIFAKMTKIPSCCLPFFIHFHSEKSASNPFIFIILPLSFREVCIQHLHIHHTSTFMFLQPKNPEFSEIKSQLFNSNLIIIFRNQIQFFLIPKSRFFRNQNPNIFRISSEFEEHKFEFRIGNVVVRFCWTQIQWSTNSMNTCYEFEKHKFVEGLMFDSDFGVVRFRFKFWVWSFHGR